LKSGERGTIYRTGAISTQDKNSRSRLGSETGKKKKGAKIEKKRRKGATEVGLKRNCGKEDTIETARERGRKIKGTGGKEKINSKSYERKGNRDPRRGRKPKTQQAGNPSEENKN